MKKFGLHPLFILLGIGFCIAGFAVIFFIYLLTVILHELAHLFTAKKLGYKLDKIFLMPFGAGLTLNQNFIDEKDEIIVALAGPILNFFLVILFISLWWIEPSTYNYTQEFVLANFVTGTVNLLPCYPLDGGRILTSYLSKKLNNRKKSLKICIFFNYFICFLFILIFFANIFNNYSFLIMGIFIFLGTFESKFAGNYMLVNFPFFENLNTSKSILNTNIIGVSGNTEIYKIAKHLKKNKYNLVYIVMPKGNIKFVSENLIKKIFQNYEINTKLIEIIK